MLNMRIFDNRIFMSKKYFCIDIETTGLDSNTEDIIEIYWCIYDFETKNIEKEDHMVFKSENYYKISDLVKIEDWEMENQPTFKEAVDCKHKFIIDLKENLYKCMNYFDQLVMVSHYSIFEKVWLTNKLHINVGSAKTFDTWDVACTLHPTGKHDTGSLTELYGIKIDNDIEHRAKYDVHRMIKIMECEIEEINKNYQ